ncbi:nuclease domain-containing protein, partial [Endozoicomonas sp. SESOKO3]
AINQMHRYRDALIHRSKFDDRGFVKTRPVFGAYVLYPGYFNQLCEHNPYSVAINEVGIGAFSLLPQVDNKGSHWLSVFLQQKLGVPEAKYPYATSERYFVEDAARIPGKGYSIAHYQGLTILASQLGPDRNQEYINQFENGDARFYHTKLIAFERQKVQQHIATEAHYLAVALDVDDGVQRRVDYIYPILKAERVQRGNLTEKQTGTPVFANPDEWFWLFSLGSALRLKIPLWQQRKVHFELKLVSRDDLTAGYGWDELPELYSSLVKE